MRKKISLNNLVSISFILILIMFWELSIIIWKIPNYILPAPTVIIKTLFATYSIMHPHIIATLKEAFLGFLLAVIFSFITAFIMDSIPLVKKALYPVIITSQTIPIISVAPLIIIWFGYGVLPKIFIALLVCFFPILISLLDGLASTDDELINLLKSMGANKIFIIRNVKLPSALPYLFSGLKISASYSIMGAIIGEWVGAKEGLGYFMILSQKSFYVDRVFSAIVIITILSLLIFKIVCILEKQLMPWQFIKENDH